MSQSASLFVPGHTYFFTLRLRDARCDLLVRHIDVLRDATRLCRKRWSFDIPAAVILPQHLHMIWNLPDGDCDVAKRWRLIRSGFARNVPSSPLPASSKTRRDGGIWQRGMWAHQIRDQDDFDRHAHVIRAAPLQAGLVTRASDWPYCSLHHCLQRGVKTTAPAPSCPDQAADARSSRTAAIAASESC